MPVATKVIVLDNFSGRKPSTRVIRMWPRSFRQYPAPRKMMAARPYAQYSSAMRVVCKYIPEKDFNQNQNRHHPQHYSRNPGNPVTQVFDQARKGVHFKSTHLESNEQVWRTVIPNLLIDIRICSPLLTTGDFVILVQDFLSVTTRFLGPF